MLSLFDGLRDLTTLSVFVRMFLAALCGGIIGLEREFKRRPAGFRTHILICLGATMTTLTSQYLYQNMHYYTDMARLGAQVVAGIGFIGAGTIIVTRQQKVKGLTTAAGLWTSAIVGLALGGGFYEGGLIVTILVILTESVLSKVGYQMLEKAPEVNLYVEYRNSDCLELVLNLLKDSSIKISNMQITRVSESEAQRSCAIFTLRLNKQHSLDALFVAMNMIDGVFLIEEL